MYGTQYCDFLRILADHIREQVKCAKDQGATSSIRRFSSYYKIFLHCLNVKMEKTIVHRDSFGFHYTQAASL